MENETARSQTHKKILIADDDSDILDALSLMLADADYDTETILEGLTVQQISDSHADLLLLDIWMSGIDGRDICRELKSREETRKLPVIMISANKNVARLSKEVGADDYLSKPFDMDDLLAKVAKYIL
jgi:DNA-binding response OmpR family regulator